ncbi:putative nucleoprotein [Fiwi virus]|uniref:Nucleoprotein n=1 Tax=Fiwi virus TaxID=2675848 RepID=A0AAE6UBD7_9MONO|nr:putative nucleoprotein [Fiwi virus]QGM12355.1 putative nucleoprotein [Fiwi virus]
MATGGGFSIDLDQILNRRQQGSGSGIGQAGLERVPIFVLANVPTPAELKFLSVAWLVVLEDPEPPAVVVSLLVELTCSAYFDNVTELLDGIQPLVGPGGYTCRVTLQGIGQFRIPGEVELERLLCAYFRPRATASLRNPQNMEMLNYRGGLTLWQVMLIQLCLASGHLFTGNPSLGTWFSRRLSGLQLNTRIVLSLTPAVFKMISAPGGSLTVVRAMVVQVMMTTLASRPIGVALVEGVRMASTYSEWAGMAWVFLSLSLVMRPAHPILLVPTVRREALALSSAIQALGADRDRLPFERILGASQASGLNAGNYPTLSSAAYGVAVVTFSNFGQYHGTVYSNVVYRAAQYLTRIITAVDTGLPDPLTGLQGQQMADAAALVTTAMSDASQTQGGSGPTTI